MRQNAAGTAGQPHGEIGQQRAGHFDHNLMGTDDLGRPLKACATKTKATARWPTLSTAAPCAFCKASTPRDTGVPQRADSPTRRAGGRRQPELNVHVAPHAHGLITTPGAHALRQRGRSCRPAHAAASGARCAAGVAAAESLCYSGCIAIIQPAAHELAGPGAELLVGTSAPSALPRQGSL